MHPGPVHQLFRPLPHREAHHSGPCQGNSTSASQLPAFHNGTEEILQLPVDPSSTPAADRLIPIKINFNF